jgi:hypothetical protein
MDKAFASFDLSEGLRENERVAVLKLFLIVGWNNVCYLWVILCSAYVVGQRTISFVQEFGCMV